jgi:hypothetical protein
LISPGVKAAIAELNEIVRADGAELRIASATATSLHLELDLSQSSCPECVVPKDLMLDIVKANLAAADPDIREVELHDPREADGTLKVSSPSSVAAGLPKSQWG